MKKAISIAALLLTFAAHAQISPPFGGGPISYTTIAPSPLTNTNVVGAGDSRMAGNMVPVGQDFLTYLAAQPQFASRATFYNGATGGVGCSQMTTDYTTKVQPHKPSGAITIAYLFIEIGINDLNAGTGASVEESCLSSYITTALADGFTPVLFTVYYSGNSSDAQDVQRQIFNDWIRQQPYLVIDVDHLFPSNSTSDAWHVNADHLNGLGNQLWARETNFLWGLGKSGTTYGPSVYHDYENPQSGQKRVSGALISGIVNSGFTTPGFIGAFKSTNQGAVFFGSDTNCYLYRNGTGSIQFTGCGPMTFDNTVSAKYFAANQGTAIASAATIAPSAGVTHITGTTSIATITAPSNCVSGVACQITLIPDGLWSTTTGGNIALATTAVVSKALILTYDATAAKWYPSY